MLTLLPTDFREFTSIVDLISMYLEFKDFYKNDVLDHTLNYNTHGCKFRIYRARILLIVRLATVYILF